MTPPAASPTLLPLAWDSDHFGMPVARLGPPDLDDDGLERGLREARRGGLRLVYWPTAPGRPVPGPLLAAFGGLLADRKATYAADDLGAIGEVAAGPLRVSEVPPGPASPRLLALAVAAGEHSRFRRDPRLPAGRFRALYETWMERSTRRELADAVLAASAPGREAEPEGAITLAVAGGEGTIGLLAVDEASRGRGVGRLLVGAAHARMRSAGASRASVVTQLENAAACRLYERCGYRLASAQAIYHFCP